MDGNLEQVVQKIEPRGKLLRAWPLKGGISAAMTALEIECADGPAGAARRVIVRQPGGPALRRNPRAARDEFKLLQLAHTWGLAAPEPVHLDESGKILPAPFLVIRYIEGHPEFAPTDLLAYIVQFAARLAQIHSVDGSRPELFFLPRLDSKVAGSLMPVAPGQPGVAQPDGALDARSMRDTLAPAWPWPRRNAPVLLHGDYWPGNTLWCAGRLTAVVDWEDAALGDPLADLAISRLDVLCIFGIDAMQAFTQQYRSQATIDDTELPYWDLWAALRLARLVGSSLADWAAFFAPFGRPDITEQTIREHYQLFTKLVLEKLEVSSTRR